MSLSRHRLLTVPALAAFIAVPGPAGVGLAKDAPARYYNPRFSADGTRVIFESTRDGKYTLYSISSDGAGLRKLTNSRQDDAQPQWSADGSLITFTRSVGGVHKVFVMDADGRNVRQISTGSRNDAAPALSPDGKHVAWAATSARPEDWREIGVAAIDGSGERLITSGPGNDQAPVWISNTRLVFVTEFPPKTDWRAMSPEDHAKRRASAELMAVDLDGSNLTALTTNTAADHSPSFAASNGRVYFGSDRGGADEIWSVNPDGSDARRMDAAMSGGSVSSDGRMLAYSRVVGDRSAIFVRSIGSATERELIGGEKPRDINHHNPAWSPDGKWIVFETNRDLADPGFSIYIVGADGHGLRKLSALSKEETQAAWSPDGKEIVFSSSRDGHLDLYLMNADGSNQRRLTETGGGGFYRPTFSPDGQWIALQGRPDKALFAERIYVVGRDGAGFKQLSPETMSTFSPKWSRDGQWIVADQQPAAKRLWDEMTPGDVRGARSGQEIVAIRPDGSEARRLTHNSNEECCARIAASESGVTFGAGEGAERKYFFVGFDGGAPRAIEPTKVDSIGGERSPDGRFVVTTRKVGEVSGVYVVEVATGRERLIAGGS